MIVFIDIGKKLLGLLFNINIHTRKWYVNHRPFVVGAEPNRLIIEPTLTFSILQGIDLVKRGRIKNSNKKDTRSQNLYIHLLIKVSTPNWMIEVFSFNSSSDSSPEELIQPSARQS